MAGLKALADLSAQVPNAYPVQNSVSILRMYANAKALQQQALFYLAGDDLENAFVFYKRFVVYVLRSIKQHNAYAIKQFEREKNEFHRYCEEAMTVLESLKLQIVAKYDALDHAQQADPGPAMNHAVAVDTSRTGPADRKQAGVGSSSGSGSGSGTGSGSGSAAVVAPLSRPEWDVLQLPRSGSQAQAQAHPQGHAQAQAQAPSQAQAQAQARGQGHAQTPQAGSGPSPQRSAAVPGSATGSESGSLRSPGAAAGPPHGHNGPYGAHASHGSAGSYGSHVTHGAHGSAHGHAHSPHSAHVPHGSQAPTGGGLDNKSNSGLSSGFAGLSLGHAHAHDHAHGPGQAPGQAASKPSPQKQIRPALRRVYVPYDLVPRFLDLAGPNTRADIETCGVLAGQLRRSAAGAGGSGSEAAFHVTHVLLPKQTGSANHVTTDSEEELIGVQEREGLLTLGWIHTHPSQTCFLSSIDLHCQLGYQAMLPEALAIVCAPSVPPHLSIGVFTLTHDGLDRLAGLYGHATHVVLQGPPAPLSAGSGSRPAGPKCIFVDMRATPVGRS